MANNPDPAHRLTDEELAKLEKRIAAVYEQAAQDMEGKVTAYFASFEKRDAEQKALVGEIVNGKEYTEADYTQWRLTQIGRGERFEAMRDKLAERMTDANEVAIAYVNDATPGIYSLNRNYAAYTIEKVAGDVGFTLWDESTVRRLIVEQPDIMPYYPPERAVQRGFDLAYGKKQITKQVTSGVLQGNSTTKVAADLMRNITTMSQVSAMRAARTAITGAQNGGRMDSYAAAQKMGIKLKKEWLATLDSRTRHSHAALDGAQVDTDKEFPNGCMYPGDPNGKPSEVYNCRCTMIAAVEGVDTGDAKRWSRNLETGQKEIVSNTTYSEWAGWKQATGATTSKVDALHPQTLAGVKRGKEMSFSEADSGNVNPKYGTNQGYSINCQSCVVGFEARQRGYDVEVLPNTAGSMLDKLSRKTNLAWIDPKTGDHPEYITDRTKVYTAKSYLKYIDSVIDTEGRYTLKFVWKGRNSGGHIVNLDRTETGELRIKDNQRGQNERSEYIGGKEVLSYLQRFKYSTSIYGSKYSLTPKILRIDTMQFDESVVSGIMKASDKK